MQLTPQFFSRVASLLSPLPFVERRSEPRENVRGTARMLRGESRPATVYVQDLSPGGAGLLSAVPVDPGAQFVLVMEEGGWEGDGAGGADGVSIICAAAYCRSLARDLYGIGVQFLRAGTDPADDDSTTGVGMREFDALLEGQPADYSYRSSDAPPST